MTRVLASKPRWGHRMVIAAAAPLVVVTAGFGVATMSAFHNPELSLMILPGNPAAADVKLTGMAAKGEIGARHPAFRELALQAYRIDATDPVPVRSLALDAQANGDDRAADALYRHAFHLSRRDYPTNIYMIAAAAKRREPAQALVYYDIALRTAPSQELLFHSLAKGFGEPALRPLLARLILQDPPWGHSFINWMQVHDQQAEGLTQVLIAARSSMLAQEPDTRRRMLAWLAGKRDYQEAYTLYRSFQDVGPTLIPSDIGFAGHRTYPPFDWSVADANTSEDGFGARIVPTGLDFWSHGRGGLIAQKLLMLSPGTYVLSGRLVRAEAGSALPVVTVVCEGSGAILITVPLTAAPTARRFETSTQCRAYRINVTLTTASDNDNEDLSGRLNLILSPQSPYSRVASQ